MNFKPTKWKVIVAIIVVIFWYLLSFQLFAVYCRQLLCEPCGENLNGISLYQSDCCGCYSNFQIYQDLIILLLPGIIVYILWSLVHKKNKTSKRR